MEVPLPIRDIRAHHSIYLCRGKKKSKPAILFDFMIITFDLCHCMYIINNRSPNATQCLDLCDNFIFFFLLQHFSIIKPRNFFLFHFCFHQNSTFSFITRRFRWIVTGNKTTQVESRFVQCEFG